MIVTDDDGKAFAPIMPRETLDDFLREGVIHQDGLEDRQHKTRFILTEDGRKRGKDDK